MVLECEFGPCCTGKGVAGLLFLLHTSEGGVMVLNREFGEWDSDDDRVASLICTISENRSVSGKGSKEEECSILFGRYIMHVSHQRGT
jgi:hypothetical protein